MKECKRPSNLSWELSNNQCLYVLEGSQHNLVPASRIVRSNNLEAMSGRDVINRIATSQQWWHSCYKSTCQSECAIPGSRTTCRCWDIIISLLGIKNTNDGPTILSIVTICLISSLAGCVFVLSSCNSYDHVVGVSICKQAGFDHSYQVWNCFDELKNTIFGRNMPNTSWSTNTACFCMCDFDLRMGQLSYPACLRPDESRVVW